MQGDFVEMKERKKEQIKRMEKEAMEQMLHYHERSKGQALKNLIKKAAGRYVPPKDFIFWPTGLIANVLADNYERWENKDEVLEVLCVYFDRWIDKGMPLYCMDDVLCGMALIDLYKLTGKERYKKASYKMAEYIYDLEDKASDKAGTLPYRYAQRNGHVYVDAIGMLCPFLCRFGVEFDDIRALRLAVLQINNMLKYGMDDNLFLPYHGFEYESKVKYGIIGWGRAVGWLLLGMAGTLRFLPAEYEGWEELSAAFNKLILCVAAYQKENGAFAWQLEAVEGPEDSSATAMIAQAVLIGIKHGIMDNKTHTGECEILVKKAAEYLSGCEKDGRIYNASGECMGFSQYPQVYGSYPWAQAPGLFVLSEEIQ